jgi:hypothetical protein
MSDDAAAVAMLREAWEAEVMTRAEHRLDCAKCQPDNWCMVEVYLGRRERIAWLAYFHARLPAIEMQGAALP